MNIPASVSKPITAGTIAYFADQYILNQPSTQRSMYMGASVALGLLVSDLIITNTSLFEKTSLGGIEARMLQVSLSTGGALGVDKFVFNDLDRGVSLNKIGLIVGSEIASDYIINTLYGTNLV